MKTDTVKHSTVQQRDSNLELYRIILMLAIIAHHFVINSGLMPACINKDLTSGRSIFLILFGAWGKTGINCFLLITGYYMCQSRITLKKFLKLILQIEFYNIIFFVIFLVAGKTEFNAKAIRELLPVSSMTDRFPSCFIVFFLFIPFLNLFIQHLSKRNHQLLLGLLLLFYTILPSLFIRIYFNYVTWFSVVYLIAAYIRLYPIPLFSNQRFWLVTFIVCVLISCASVLFFLFLSSKKYYYWLLADSNKMFAVATAISLFLLFKNLKLKYNPVINILAQSVFGVLLIHENCDAMRKWLWETLQNIRIFESSWPVLLLHAFGSVIGIYLICTAIDQVRIHLFEKPFFDYFGDRIDRIQTKIISFFGMTD